MNIFLNGPGYQPRVLLLGGTSEIGLAILAALDLPADAEVILAGRDEQRLVAAGKTLPAQVQTYPYDATQPEGHQAFVDGVLAGLGWGMNPESRVRPHLDAGRLVELLPGRPLDVSLTWTFEAK